MAYTNLLVVSGLRQGGHKHSEEFKAIRNILLENEGDLEQLFMRQALAQPWLRCWGFSVPRGLHRGPQ